MKVEVHNHFNARKLCEIVISDTDAARLDTPPALKENLVQLPDGRVVNMPKPEDHVVEIGSGSGLIRLFKAKVNGIDLVMTNTPAAVLARVA